MPVQMEFVSNAEANAEMG